MGNPCPYCDAKPGCKNDLLHHIIINHDANMDEWPTPCHSKNGNPPD